MCGKRSEKSRRVRAQRETVAHVHDMRSGCALRARARWLRVFSSSERLRTRGERGTWEESCGVRVGAVGGLPRATHTVDLDRCVHHETLARRSWTALNGWRRLGPRAGPVGWALGPVRVSRDPQMLEL